MLDSIISVAEVSRTSELHEYLKKSFVFQFCQHILLSQYDCLWRRQRQAIPVSGDTSRVWRAPPANRFNSRVQVSSFVDLWTWLVLYDVFMNIGLIQPQPALRWEETSTTIIKPTIVCSLLVNVPSYDRVGSWNEPNLNSHHIDWGTESTCWVFNLYTLDI